MAYGTEASIRRSDEPTSVPTQARAVSDPAQWFERMVPIAAAVTFIGALAASSLLADPAVDAVAQDREQARTIVDAVAAHPTQVRLSFLFIVIALACIGPVVRPFRRLAPERGALLTELGYRGMCIGSIAAAVGNAYAPLVLASTAGLDRDVMADFALANETSAASYAILAVYALLPIGAILMAVGLFRAHTLPWWQPMLFGVAFAAIMPCPIGPASLVLTVGFAVVLVVLRRRLGAVG